MYNTQNRFAYSNYIDKYLCRSACLIIYVHVTLLFISDAYAVVTAYRRQSRCPKIVSLVVFVLNNFLMKTSANLEEIRSCSVYAENAITILKK